MSSVGATLRGAFSASDASLVYVHPQPLSSMLTWFNRLGQASGVVGEAGVYLNLAISPDDRHLAVSRVTGSPGNVDIWTIDLDRDVAPSRLTFDPSGEFDPAWSPDGHEIVFTSTKTGLFDVYRHAADGSGSDELVFSGGATGASSPSFSPDGRFLLYVTSGDIWVMPLTGERKPSPYLADPRFAETDPRLSPDGSWVAYQSNESGRSEIYVQSFPAGRGKFMISRDGGTEPIWRGDSRELFFLGRDESLMAAGVEFVPEFRSIVPRKLFSTGLTTLQNSNNHPYVVTRDGQRFLVAVPRTSAPPEATVVLNWPSRLR